MRICVLGRMDVVGMKAIAKQCDDYYDSISSIVDAANSEVRHINAALDGNQKLIIKQMYGDTIDIYFECGDHDAFMTIKLIDTMVKIRNMMLENGIFVKGGISRGEIEDQSMFTGDALINASDLEKSSDSFNIRIEESLTGFVRDVAMSLFNVVDDLNSFYGMYIFEDRGKCYINCIRNLNKPSHLNQMDVIALSKSKDGLMKAIERYAGLNSGTTADGISKRIDLYEATIEHHNNVCDIVGYPQHKILCEFEVNLPGITVIWKDPNNDRS